MRRKRRIFRFSCVCAEEKHLISEKSLNKRFFKGTGVVLAEHNNRLPPVADKRRVLWRRGQRKFAFQANIFFGHRKRRECSPKICDFRASGIPVQECAEVGTLLCGGNAAFFVFPVSVRQKNIYADNW